MRSKIVILLVIFQSMQLFGQAWRTELDKHQDKPVYEIIKQMDRYFEKVGATRENKHHHYIRWQIQAINHMNGEGFQFNHARKNKELLTKLNKKIGSQSSSSRHYHGLWESVNPDNFQNPANVSQNMGRINAVAISPTNPNVIYVGAAGGGVWKSYNHGASWIPLWDGMVQMGVSDIIVDYNNSNHIIVLSGSADGKEIPSSGIMESFDGGDTWIRRFDFKLKNKSFLYKMVQSPTNPSIFYVGLANFNSFFGGVYKMDLSQNTFAIVSSNVYVYDMAYSQNGNNTLFYATSSGLFKMDDNESSTLITNGLPTGSTRGAVAVAPSNSNHIYYLNVISVDSFALYKSINGGDVFTKVIDETDEPGLLGQITINLNLTVDPTNSNTVYIGSVLNQKSTNGGASWNEDKENMHADIHDVIFENGRHYVCNDGGIVYRENGDTDWISISNGLLVTQFYKMDKKGNKLVGGTQDNGTMFWNEGDAVGIRKIASDGFDCIYHPTIENRILATTQENLFVSTDNGETTTNVLPHRWAAPIVHWQNIPSQVITFDKDNLRFSFDNGNSWPESINIFSDTTVYLYSGFDQCDSNPNIAYSTGDEQIVKTTNLNLIENSVWDSLSLPKESELIYRHVLVHPNNCNEVYVTLAGYNQEQIYKSIDGGSTWEVFNQGLEDMPVYCMYYDHVNGNGFYIGTELGVFYRNSTMNEWIPFSTHLPRVQVMDLNITDTHVYAATFGRGIWKSERYQTCQSNITLTQANDPTAGTHSGQQIYKASNILTSSRIIRGSLGVDVHYQAGNRLDLLPGFHAKQFSDFRAIAAGCLEEE